MSLKGITDDDDDDDDPDFPHILCLTEHHLKHVQLETFHIGNYKLDAHYCRQQREKGGVAIFVHNSLVFFKY
jgi:hypothetical protein